MVRASACGGRAEKNGRQAEPELGRSRDGFSTKIHVSTDGLGNSLRFALTGDQRHDITRAEALCEGWTCQYVIADRACDTAAFLQRIAERVLKKPAKAGIMAGHEQKTISQRCDGRGVGAA